MCVCAQSCLTFLVQQTSPPGCSVYGIFQARILECHFLFQGIFPTQRLNLCLLHLLHWQADYLPLVPLGTRDQMLASHIRSMESYLLYILWNSPGQNTGVGSFSLLQDIFPIQGLNPGLPHCRRILYQLRHTKEAQEYWSEQPTPFPVDLPDPGIELGSPALQVDSLPTELSKKPLSH